MLVSAVLFGCSAQKSETSSSSQSSADSSISESSPAVDESSSVSEESSSGDEEASPPEFAVNAVQVIKLRELAAYFNVYPEEFTDASQLSDYCIFFTAATACAADDISGTEMQNGISLDTLYDKIDEYFGGKASLSDSWYNLDYSPYTVDMDAGVIKSVPTGSSGSYYYPYKVLETGEDTYELWLIDLMDPLYYDDEENKTLVDSGSLPGWADIKDIAGSMQTNIYTFTVGENGYYLSGFRYLNYKNIDHYGF